MSHQQYVVVPSNSSMEYFPDNTLASFRVKLGKPLILEGQYDVALTEIIYPHRRLTVQPSEATVTIEMTTPKKKKKKQSKKQQKKPAPQIWDVVDDRIDLMRSKKGKEPKIVSKPAVAKPVLNAKARATNDIPREKRSSKDSGLRSTQVVVSQYTLPAGTYDTAGDLFKALHNLTLNSGIFFNMNPTSGLFRVDVKSTVTKVTLSPRMAHMLGFTRSEEPYVVNASHTADHLPHLDSSAHSLYIYTSIVDHQLVGNAVAPLAPCSLPRCRQVGTDCI